MIPCLRRGRARQEEMLWWSMRSLAVLLTIPSSFRCESECVVHEVNVRFTEMLAGKEQGSRTMLGRPVRFGHDAHGHSKG